MTPTGHVDLDGRLVGAARARVSVFDRGLLYGDGLFETLRCYRGRPFDLDGHVSRLEQSCAVLGIEPGQVDWRNRIARLLARDGLERDDAWVRITVTRGSGARGLLPPKRTRPTVLIAAGRLDPALAKWQRRGVDAILLPFSRSGFLAEHKTTAYLSGVVGKALAAEHGAYEGLFVDTVNRVTEGTTTNVFAVRRGRLVTPPASGILAGRTRGLVAEVLAPAKGVAVEERPLPVRALAAADEAFLTSSLVEIVPLIRLGGRSIGTGRPGPVTREMQRQYRRLVRSTLSSR